MSNKIDFYFNKFNKPVMLFAGVLIVAGLAVVLNILISIFDPFGSTGTKIIPEGWEWVERVIGGVWVTLLMGLAVASWLIWKSGAQDASAMAWWIIAFMMFCLLYPFTFGLSRETSFIGNIITLLIAIWLTYKVRRYSTIASILVGLVVIWVSIATVYLVRLIQVNSGWIYE